MENNPYFDIGSMYDVGMRAEDIPKDTREKADKSQRRKPGSKADRPTVYDPATEESYPKYSKQHYDSMLPAERPGSMTSSTENMVPPTDREFDELYFKDQGNPYNIDPMTETNRASLGREQLFEDMFYTPYAERDNLNDEDKKQWESSRKAYDKNIYGAAKSRKDQAIKQYERLKGYNTKQRQRYNTAKKQEESRRRYFQNERQSIEKELYRLDVAISKTGWKEGLSKEHFPEIKAIEKRRKQLEGYLKQIPGSDMSDGVDAGEPAKRQEIAETRVWKGKTIYKLNDGSVVFADKFDLKKQ